MSAAVVALLFLVLAGALAGLARPRKLLAVAALLLGTAAALPMHAPCTLAAATLVVADGMRVEAAIPLLVASGVGLTAIAMPSAAAAIAGALGALLLARIARDAWRTKLRAHALVDAGARASLALALATELAPAHRLAPAARVGASALAAALGLVALALVATAYASAARRRLAARHRRSALVNASTPADPRVPGDAAATPVTAPRAENASATMEAEHHAALTEALKRIVHELRQPVGAASNALVTAKLPGTEGALAEDLRALAATELTAALEALEALARLSRAGVGEPLALPITDALVIALGAHADHVRFAPAAEGVIDIDPSQLAHALDALVRNARDACEAPPVRVETLASPSNDRLLVRVVDGGSSPAAEALARAAEPFFTTRAGRLGIGATHAAAFARAMGGGLELRREGPYTVAELALPLTRRPCHATSKRP